MPARLRDIVRAFRELGGDVSEPSSGSHWRACMNGRVYPLPAHNGMKQEIADTYIRGLCRTFDLDEADFRKRL